MGERKREKRLVLPAARGCDAERPEPWMLSGFQPEPEPPAKTGRKTK